MEVKKMTEIYRGPVREAPADPYHPRFPDVNGSYRLDPLQIVTKVAEGPPAQKGVEAALLSQAGAK